MVLGLPYTGNNIGAQVLQNFANAGAGQPVALATGNGTTSAMAASTTRVMGRGRNSGHRSWPNLYAAAGQHRRLSDLDRHVLGDRSAAPVYTPSGADTQSLIDQISGCTDHHPPELRLRPFDPQEPDKGRSTKLSEGGVFLNGVPVPLDPNNMDGWDMVRTPSSSFRLGVQDVPDHGVDGSLNLEFPCDLVIIIDKP